MGGYNNMKIFHTYSVDDDVCVACKLEMKMVIQSCLIESR